MTDLTLNLSEQVSGRIITVADADYDDARKVYNAMHDCRPGAIIQCADAADVMAVVSAARKGALDLAVRGGGHSVPGFGTIESGLVIDIHCAHGAHTPHVSSSMHLHPINGAAQRVGPDETAFGHRDKMFSPVIAGIWDDPAENEANIRWARDYYDAIHPHSEGEGGYMNFMSGDDGHRAVQNYGDNYARLAAVKAIHDPDNVFHVNQNIQPATKG